MPEPTTVWLSRPDLPEGRRGTLTLQDGTLTFAADPGGRTVVRGAQVRRVRRLRGSPVLEVRYEGEGEDRILLLYFAEPPSPDSPPRPLGPVGFLGLRGMSRMQGMHRLRTANRRLKATIDRWAEAIGEASGA